MILRLQCYGVQELRAIRPGGAYFAATLSITNTQSGPYEGVLHSSLSPVNLPS
jgi:hypothetical protein